VLSARSPQAGTSIDFAHGDQKAITKPLSAVQPRYTIRCD